MYGRGNYAPQFGQGLQRPMPPFQQPPAGHLAPLQFQPGQPFPMQQGGMPHAGPPRGPGYPHILPSPLNAGQSFGQRPLVQGGPPARYPFPGSQQNFPSSAPNPPPSVGPSGSLPPPPLQRPAAYSLLVPHSNPGMQQGVRHMSLLPPPPPHAPTGFFPLPRQPPGLPPPQPPSSMPMVPNMPSSSIAGGSPMTHGDIPQKQILESASVEVKIDGGREGSLMSHTDMSMRESALLEHSSPPKPADETVRNIEVLCQFIAKNGSQFEEMVRKNESGNPKFSFLVGGEPGSEASSAREYYLWMKKKYGLLNDSGNGQEEKNLSQSHPDVNVATVCSPADSDVDMEDDITQTDKESEVYNSFEDLNSGSVSTGVMLEMQKQETTLLYANDGSSALKSPVKSEEQKEIKPEDSSGQLGKTDSSFGLVQNYASDDNSDDELPDELGGAQAVTPPPKSAVPTLRDDSKSVDKVLTEREALAVQTLTTCGSSDNHEIDGRYDGDEPSNLNPTFHGSSGIDSTSSKGIEALAVQTESQGTSTDVGLMGKHAIDDKFDGDNERKDKTRTLSAVNVDEFGRLVKEGASDSDSDDTQYVRHRGRKNQSRSRSRSPPDRKRRSSPLRSPRRRKGRRSRSRSRSPKRRRSRSRSPYHSVGDFSGEKLRQGKVQTQECFDFSKGRCYRGASCRYLHHDMDFRGSEGHREDASDVRGASEVHLPQHPIGWENPTFEMPSMSQSVHSLAETHKKCDDYSTIVGSGKIDSSADVTSVISPSGISTDSYHVLAANKPTSPRASISTFRNQASHSPQQLLTSQSITSSSFPLQTVSFNAVPPYHAPLPGQKSPHPDPANLRWGDLPTSQPRPAHVIDSSISGAPFQQGDIHMRNELPNYMSLRVQPGELTGHPQVGRFQYQTYHLPSSNVSGTQFAGPSVVRDGGSQSVSSYASEPLVREQPSHVASVGASGIAAHYNPYASTFDQPLSSRFSSAFAQERVSSSGIKYDHSFSLSHGPGEGQAASGYESRQILSSPSSSRAGDRMPRLGGVQYDPLFDSIEPSSKRAVKEDQAVDNSDMLKVGSHKTLDVAENKQKEVVATTSLDNDEYGETADAEVGVVENGSLSDTDDDAIIAEGEIEIDQIKGGGNDTTIKDSRSMKLFKVAVANFVKEVLKPQWRQGNMSKEVFKTIVKKTVDKVSGAMKNHRVPKSQAKIDQYINSSRRKLIQLVEGYVSKYKS